LNPSEIDLDILEYHPLAPDRWNDFEKLFGKRGAYGGCWCMWWRCSRREFEKNQGEKNRLAMKKLVDSGNIPGLMAYYEDNAIGWCSVAPREEYSALERSRVMKRLDEEPVWSIVCFFIDKKFRDLGIGERLINAAVEYVRKNGGYIVEAYPTYPKENRLPPVSSFMGFPQLFERAGFTECARPSRSRSIMRYYIK
jgi:GNAT superfamily N-acetyltransferase